MKTNEFVNSKVSWRSWIGLEKIDGAWVWQDGSGDTWRNWIPRQPSGDGAFVEIVRNVWAGKSGQWNDLGLEWRGQTNLRGSVCQYDLKGTTPYPNFIFSTFKYQFYLTLSGCDAGWTYFDHTGKCYKSFETRLTRAAAIQGCKSSNPTAALVSIPDMTTNDFVLSMVTWRSWTGLEKVNGAWVWPDGSEDTLRNWIPRQPSGDGSHVEIVKNAWAGKSGQWNDLGLEWGGQTNLRGSVCQYDP